MWPAALMAGLLGVAVLMRHRYKYWDSLGGFCTVAMVVACCAWLAENSSIVMYRHYSYSPAWLLMVHKVPLHVVMIWPLFILGEYHYLSRGLGLHVSEASPWQGLALRGCFCFVDTALLAYLIEVYCVSAGLWTWSHANCLGVPLIGVIGWALFATPVVLVLSALLASAEVGQRPERTFPPLMLLPLVSLAWLHCGLVVAWHLLGAKHLVGVVLSPEVTAVGILVVQGGYQMAVVALQRRHKIAPRLILSDELPRLLACSIVAGIWVFGGTMDFGTVVVSAASLVRVLTFTWA